jgi:hypothetical protein
VNLILNISGVYRKYDADNLRLGIQTRCVAFASGVFSILTFDALGFAPEVSVGIGFTILTISHLGLPFVYAYRNAREHNVGQTVTSLGRFGHTRRNWFLDVGQAAFAIRTISILISAAMVSASFYILRMFIGEKVFAMEKPNEFDVALIPQPRWLRQQISESMRNSTRPSGDPVEAFRLYAEGMRAYHRGDLVSANRLFEESNALFPTSACDLAIASFWLQRAKEWLTNVLLTGDYFSVLNLTDALKRADEAAQEAMRESKVTGDRLAEVLALIALGDVQAHGHGPLKVYSLTRAVEYWTKALNESRHIGERNVIAAIERRLEWARTLAKFAP